MESGNTKKRKNKILTCKAYTTGSVGRDRTEPGISSCSPLQHFAKLEQIFPLLPNSTRITTNISTSAIFHKFWTFFLVLPNLTKFGLNQIQIPFCVCFLCLWIYAESGNLKLFNWELATICMIIGANDSDRADTPDEWTLGEISVTACMILLWVRQK